MNEIHPTATRTSAYEYEVTGLTIGKFRVLAQNLPETLEFFFTNPWAPVQIVACWQDLENPDEWWVQTDLSD